MPNKFFVEKVLFTSYVALGGAGAGIGLGVSLNLEGPALWMSALVGAAIISGLSLAYPEVPEPQIQEGAARPR